MKRSTAERRKQADCKGSDGAVAFAERHLCRRRAFAIGMNHLTLVVGQICVLSLLSACSSEKTYHWEEEVVISTGERLTLDRTLRFEKISAPFNPFKSEWAWGGSTFVVREGPADVKNARYDASLVPMLLDRDPMTRNLIVVGIPVTCVVYKTFEPDQGWLYLAFRLSANQQMRQVRIPDWAWERRLNLLKPNLDNAPPAHVSPAFTNEFNRNISRGEPSYFQVRRISPLPTCER